MIGSDRIGRFSIDWHSYEKEIKRLEQVFCKMRFVPVRVECLGYEATYELTGISHLFDEVKKGEVIPEYVLTNTIDQDGQVTRVHVDKLSGTGQPYKTSA